MKPVPVGAKGSFSPPEQLANRFEHAATQPAVLPIGLMVLMIENAALNAIKAYLDPGERAVSTAVDIRCFTMEVAACRVTAEAMVTKVIGRRIEFMVQANEGAREIGVGTHERVVVDKAKPDGEPV
jgi:fluoroacetyl-CoA thioesterase